MSGSSDPGGTGDSGGSGAFARARRLRFVVIFLVLLCGIGWLVARGARNTMVYYVTVSELLAKEPGADLDGLRVLGHVEPGTIQRQDFHLSFRLTDGASPLSVAYDGVIPDTFAENGEVVVEGQMGADGVFHADFLMAKCPSKYEVDPEDMKPKSTGSGS